MAKVPTINHTFSIDFTVWPKTPGKQRCTYKAGHSKGLEVTSQGPLKGQASPWARLILTAQPPPPGRGGGDAPTDPSLPSAPGKIEFTWQEVMIGLESSLLMFPINLLIVQIFRNTRPQVTKEQNTGKCDGGSPSPVVSPQPMEKGLLTPEVVTKVCSEL